MARNQTIRTANEIINSVLTRIGNLDLQDEAQAELNNIMARLYEDYKWPFLVDTVEGTVSAGETNVNLPDDFNQMNHRFSFRLVTAEGAIIPSQVISDPDFDIMVAIPAGTPQGIHIDSRANTFRTVPFSNVALNYALTYQLTPDPITNFDLPINFPNDPMITQLLFVWACQHEDDDRYTTEYERGEKMISNFFSTFSANALRQSRLALRPGVFNPLPNRR